MIGMHLLFILNIIFIKSAWKCYNQKKITKNYLKSELKMNYFIAVTLPSWSDDISILQRPMRMLAEEPRSW